MACIEVFAAGDCFSPIAGGRTGICGSLRVIGGVSSFASWRNPVTT